MADLSGGEELLSSGEELLSSGEELLSSGEETLLSSVDISSGVDMLSSGEDDNISLDDGTAVYNSVSNESIYLDDGSQEYISLDNNSNDNTMASAPVLGQEKPDTGVEQSGEFTCDDLHNDLLQLTATVADLNDDVKTIGMNNALSDKVIIYVLCMIIGAFIAYCIFSKFSG